MLRFPTPSQQAQSGGRELSINNVSLDVVVASKTGDCRWFSAAGEASLCWTTVFHRRLLPFREVSRGQGTAEVVIVVDAVNARSETVSYERAQIGERSVRTKLSSSASHYVCHLY